MENDKSSHQPISTYFEGCWVSENGNHEIQCSLNDDRTWLICTWPNEYVEIYQSDSENLIGLTNSEIVGYPSEDIHGLIIWNSGNRWIKEGNYIQSKSNNILDFTISKCLKLCYQ